MAADLAWAWLHQAASDLAASDRCYDHRAEETICHAIAKHQQAVEKAVKAIVAALNDRGVINVATGFRHDVERLVSVLTRLPHRPSNKEIQNQIHGLLNEHHRGEIKAICLLAPKRPGAGELARRNSEYPYQNRDGTWRAPSDDGSFGKRDIERFRLVANRILDGSFRIVSAIYR